MNAMDAAYENLAEGLRSLSEASLSGFAEIFGPRIRAILLHLGLSPVEADDLANNLLTDIPLVHLSKYRSGVGRFQFWVDQVVRNAAADHLRDPRRIACEPLDRQKLVSAFEPAETPGEWSDRRSTLVDQAVEHLSPTDQHILTLRFAGEPTSFGEIGRQLGITDVNARVRFHRALRKLESELADDPRLFGPRATASSKESTRANSDAKGGPTPDPAQTLLTALGGRIRLLPGHQIGLYKFAVSQTPGSELLIASPYLITDLTRTYLNEEVEEFEFLVNDPRTSERQLQRFLEAHPKFLLGHSYERLYSQIVLERDRQGPLIPDFILQPIGRSFCDIVDLKLPKEPVIIGSQNRERFSATIYEAAAQLRRYRDYFDEPKHRTMVQQRYSIQAYRPRLAVIIGRAPNCDDILYKQIEDGVRDIEVITYDDLIKRAKRFQLT